MSMTWKPADRHEITWKNITAEISAAPSSGVPSWAENGLRSARTLSKLVPKKKKSWKAFVTITAKTMARVYLGRGG